MIFNPENKTIQLCAKGMDLEGEHPQKAAMLFQQAWNEADNDFDRSIAAHYLAPQQDSIENKLKWDQIALELAINSANPNMKALCPSLCLNVGKGYEDLHDFARALENYRQGLSFSDALNEDGYGKMIRSGLTSGIKRVTQPV